MKVSAVACLLKLKVLKMMGMYEWVLYLMEIKAIQLMKWLLIAAKKKDRGAMERLVIWKGVDFIVIVRMYSSHIQFHIEIEATESCFSVFCATLQIPFGYNYINSKACFVPILPKWRRFIVSSAQSPFGCADPEYRWQNYQIICPSLQRYRYPVTQWGTAPDRFAVQPPGSFAPQVLYVTLGTSYYTKFDLILFLREITGQI